MKKILVIEDDTTYLSFWRRFLERMGYEVLEATTIKQANHLLHKHPCSLIICDVVLPDGNGYEILNNLSYKEAGTPIIFATAYGAKLSHFNFSAQRFHILHKPFQNLDQLQRLITHMIQLEDVYQDADEDSFTENEDMPEVTEWHL